MGSNKKRVTREIYNNIKRYIRDNNLTAADDPKVMAKFHYGKTTIRLIRNTRGYDNYLERIYRYHGYPRVQQTAPKKAAPVVDDEPTDNTWEKISIVMLLVGVLIGGILALIVMLSIYGVNL